MIRPETVEMLVKMTPTLLSTILDFSGYPDCKFTSVFFQGITESGKFKYNINFREDGCIQQGAVFVAYDHATQMLTADF